MIGLGNTVSVSGLNIEGCMTVVEIVLNYLHIHLPWELEVNSALTNAEVEISQGASQADTSPLIKRRKLMRIVFLFDILAITTFFLSLVTDSLSCHHHYAIMEICENHRYSDSAP